MWPISHNSLYFHSLTVYNSLIHFTNACNTLRTQPVGYSQWQRHQFNLKCRLRYSKYRNNTFWWPNFNIWLGILHRYTRDRCHDTLWIVRFFLHSIWFFLLIRKGFWFHWNSLDFQGFFFQLDFQFFLNSIFSSFSTRFSFFFYPILSLFSTIYKRAKNTLDIEMKTIKQFIDKQKLWFIQKNGLRLTSYRLNLYEWHLG